MKKLSSVSIIIFTMTILIASAAPTRAGMLAYLPTDFLVSALGTQNPFELLWGVYSQDPDKEFLFLDYTPESTDVEALDFSGFDSDRRQPMPGFDAPVIIIIEIPSIIYSLSSDEKSEEIKDRIICLTDFYAQNSDKDFLFLDYESESDVEPLNFPDFDKGDTSEILSWIEQSTDWNFTPVPEPATIILLGTGFLVITGASRKWRGRGQRR